MLNIDFMRAKIKGKFLYAFCFLSTLLRFLASINYSIHENLGDGKSYYLKL